MVSGCSEFRLTQILVQDKDSAAKSFLQAFITRAHRGIGQLGLYPDSSVDLQGVRQLKLVTTVIPLSGQALGKKLPVQMSSLAFSVQVELQVGEAGNKESKGGVWVLCSTLGQF